jgi:diguanylate cyclase (GGDEF)-like protein/PAS domain S-box-containing protein
MPHVLIVDDSPTNLILLSRRVEALADDLQVTTFGDGQAALDWLSGQSVQLIIADYQMPGMNGVTFTRNCRTLLHCQDTPIVMVTASRRRKVCLAALKAGATEFLNSPVNDAEFRERIGPLLKTDVRPVFTVPAPEKAPGNAPCGNAMSPALPDQKALAQILDATPAMLSAFDRSGRCLYINAPHTALVETTASSLLGSAISTFPKSLQEMLHHQRDVDLFEHVVPVLHFEHQHQDASGLVRHLVTTKTPLLDDGGRVSAVLNTTIDATGRKRAEDNLLYVAEHDSLTELPNRLSLRTHVAKCIDEAAGNPDAGLALLFIDIDRFKNINDAFGHQAGDRLLIQIASRVDTALRSSDFVARIGGDEFAIVLDGVTSVDVALRRANDICRIIEQPLVIQDHEVRVSASIGVACYPDCADTIDDLLVRADLAMYRAKERGGNDCHAHRQGDVQRARKRTTLESELNQALLRQEFRLHYQPLVRLCDHTVIGAEALVRWQHPVRGLVPPGEFLAVAESCNVILELGEWILDQACRDAARWQTQIGGGIGVAVNLAPAQFARQNVPALVRKSLTAHGLGADCLTLELTEQTMLTNTPALKTCLTDLRALGCGLSLDDFGTGYASLTSLQAFPITEIKIDRSFVSQLSDQARDAAIVDAISSLGRSLSLDVVAEGVETQAQAQALRDLGCTAAQGYFFARPAAVEDFITSVNRLRDRSSQVAERCA